MSGQLESVTVFATGSPGSRSVDSDPSKPGGASETIGGRVDERKLDFGQIYGYTVCLVAVLAFLVGAVRLVGAGLDMRELPYTPSYVNGPSLVSLEAFKLDLLSQVGLEEGSGAVASFFPTDSTLRRMLDAERLHRLALSHQISRRTLVVNLVLVGLAVLIFAAHWMWLRARERTSGGEAS